MNLTQKQIRIYRYLLNHQRVLPTSLITASLFVLVFCRQISGYFSNYDINYWFDYFIITERLSMILLLLSAPKYLREKCWLGYELLLAFLLQDFIDRVFLDIRIFNINDIICRVVIGVQLIIKIYKKYIKNDHRTKNK